MKKVLFIGLFGLFSVTLCAQQYSTAIGLKGGAYGLGTGGVNLKHFLSSGLALDATVGGGANHLSLNALFQWQSSTGLTDGLDWYFGVGGTLGITRFTSAHPVWGKQTSGTYLLGNGVIGLEYIIPDLPINIALETGPYIGVLNAPMFGWGGALAVRYILK